MDRERKLFNQFTAEIVQYLQNNKGPGYSKTSEITSHIYISNWDNACDMSNLKDHDIQGILHLGEDPKPDKILKGYQKIKMEHHYIKIDDSTSANIMAHLDICYEYIRRFIEADKNILVHCNEGVSRAPTVVAYYLLKRYYLTNFRRADGIRSVKNRELVSPEMSFVLDIIKFIKQSRQCIVPNPGFVQQLLIMEHRMKHNLRDIIEQDAKLQKKTKKKKPKKPKRKDNIWNASSDSEDLFASDESSSSEEQPKRRKSKKKEEKPKRRESKKKEDKKKEDKKKESKTKKKKSKVDELEDLSSLESDSFSSSQSS